MNYKYTKLSSFSFEETVQKLEEFLKKEGFGILCRINAKKTLKEKMDIDFEDYLILGACNPSLAYESLKEEKNAGLFLPCSVVVYKDGKKIFISLLKPTTAFSFFKNKNLDKMAKKAEAKLMRAMENF